MDRLQELYRASLECLAGAVASSAQYAVNMNPADLELFREHLAALEKLVLSEAAVEDLRNVKASFRGELRDYQHQVHQRIESLREEVRSAAAAMQSFADNVVANGADHEEQLERDLQKLDSISKGEDLVSIRGGIHAATSSIASSIEKMRRSNQLVIAQLSDEIRNLHREIQAERRAQATDHASGAWNRQKLIDQIDELFHHDDPFSLLLIRLSNLKDLEQHHSRSVVEGTLKALVLRLNQIVSPNSTIGRWSGEEFAAILPIVSLDSAALTREVSHKLSGQYTVQENGLSQSVALQIKTVIIERRGGVVSDSFLKRVEQLGATLGPTK